MTLPRAAAIIALIMTSALPVRADTPGEALFNIGNELCLKAMEGDASIYDASGTVAHIDGSFEGRAGFCGCVGREFTDYDADYLATLQGELAPGSTSTDTLQFAMAINTAICLDPDRLTDMEADVIDGDLVGTDLSPDEIAVMGEGFTIDEHDVFMCEMTLRGDMLAPGFNADEVTTELEATGRSREDLCQCAATWFASEGEPLQRAIETAANPTLVYSSSMAGAINFCMN